METHKVSLFSFLLCIFGILIKIGNAKELSHKVHCTEDLMRIEIALPSPPPPPSSSSSSGSSGSSSTGQNVQYPQIYLDGLKGYPDIRCQPIFNGTLAEFRLSLKNFYECGVTRMINKITGKKVYYHKIIIDNENSNEIVKAKCITSGPIYNVMTNRTHQMVRRDVLPAGFQEPEDLEITTSLTEHAPEPILGVGVRQGGEIVTGELNVSPGTPLTMEIYLDKESAPVYGLGVTYMEVTDTKSQEETIIFNGCSVDPYLFENFNTNDGDFLTAKFRAFKFPESTYVQFRATVNVCLNKCQGTQCSNGQIGYGKRKRREIQLASESSSSSPIASDPNKIYEISLAAFIKVSEQGLINKNELLELEEKLRQLKINNQKLPRNSRRSAMETTIEDFNSNNNNNNNNIFELLEQQQQSQHQDEIIKSNANQNINIMSIEKILSFTLILIVQKLFL